MNYSHETWYQFLDEGMRDLVNLSCKLISALSSSSPSGLSPRDERLSGLGVEDLPPSSFSLGEIHDFAFIVFPMAKAYEGFLKKWFYANGLIDKETYSSDHFRIGKALNPSLPARFKDNRYVYDKIITQCHDPHLGDRLWQAWKQGRNLPFHYFPQHQHFLTIKQAKELVEKLAMAMADAMSCKVNHNENINN